MNTDTIAAISSGLTTSGIGIVRVSGPEAIKVSGLVSRCKNDLNNVKSHTVNYGYVMSADQSKKTIDEALFIVMRAPHSYTGEDVVEIQCHGGPFIMKQILEALINAGARLAEPGEFTKRAFLNGRLDLSQAESVMELIDSKSEFARRAALEGLKGAFGKKVGNLREKLLYETAYLEAALDDPEHISLDGYSEKLAEIIKDEIFRIKKLIEKSDEGRILREGIKTVILGRPNAGKSTLLNLLTGTERAIVTDIPGTTRDTLEESVRVGEIMLRLIDTAGLRKTTDKVEEIGVERAISAAELSNLILYIIDASRGLGENELMEISDISEKTKKSPILVIINKTDIAGKEKISEIKNAVLNAGIQNVSEVIALSAKSGEEIETLKKAITNLFYSKKLENEEELLVANSRQKEALIKAKKALENVLDGINAGVPEDLYTVDLMDAYKALGIITGDSVTEDLVNEIFSKFCMGK